eukprot:GFKZ01002124.1.p1 GENE.GFKZ01002124.1~~GFKZ01002124.1.p1  ORF type:complete len:807 (+),score=134.79 GFKZ01002124.1:63-2483(+)
MASYQTSFSLLLEAHLFLALQVLIILTASMAEPVHLSDEQKLAFVKNGYTILRAVVPEHLLSTANQFIDQVEADGNFKGDTRKILGEDIPTYRFQRETAEAPQITDLLFKAGLFETAEDLLGSDFAVVTGNMGHLDLVPTCEVFVKRGMKMNRPHPKKRWKVYAGMGKHAKKGAGYNVMINIALTGDQNSDEQRGQIVVWPGSHLKTQTAIAETVRSMSDGDDALKILHHEKDRADCGDPLRLQLEPGDVLVAHQKLAIGAAPNLSEKSRRSVFFRIAHSHTDSIVDEQIHSPLPWVGFAGLADFVEEHATEISTMESDGKPTFRNEPGDGVVLTTEQKETFIRDGFLVIRGAVSQDNVSSALNRIQEALEKKQYNINGVTKPGSKHPVPGFHKPVKQAPEVLNLVYGSVLFSAAEELLGKGNVVIRENLGQIAYTTTSEEFIAQGMSIDEPHPKFKWHIDAGHGKYATVGSDFSLLMGACLSDGQYIDENRGQFNVWRGSHLKTHTALSEVIAQTPTNDVVRTFKEQKLDVGDPERALLRPGDVFIAHQRLAHAAGINLSDVVRINVYFRAIDKRLDSLLHDFVRSPTPWVGFDGLKDLLPERVTEFDMNAGKKKGRMEIAASSCPEESGSYGLTNEMKEAFVRDGYVVLPEVVSPKLVSAALSATDKAYGEGFYHSNGNKRLGSRDPIPAFLRKVKRKAVVKDLFFKSGLVHACEQLLGNDRVTLREDMADISYVPANEEFVQQGMDKTAAYPKKQWKLSLPRQDYKGVGADFNLLVGVAISEGLDEDENRGQLTVWPGMYAES